jgi:hypothetical protein
MKKFLYLLFTIIFLTSCSDGDVLEVALDFDQELDLCDQSTTTYLVYDIKQNPYESLSLTFPINTTNALIFNPTENPYTSTFNINGSTVRFIYRTYDGNPQNLLCQLVPDPNTNILKNYESPSGLVTTETTYDDDDEDGIPTELEDLNIDGDDNPETDPTDSDNDGIPNYKDADDDNDNILTKFENPNYTDTDGLINAQDTDGDSIPDYLDDDDDDDGVITRYEDENGDKNPRNDFDETSVTPDIPRYLDNSTVESFPIDELVPNIFRRSFTVNFILTDIDLQILSTDFIELGNYTYSIIFE